jgi:hypothetical protein
VKTAFAVVALVAVGCASPKNAANDPIGSSSPDLGDGSGGNGADQDLAMPGGGTGVVGGGGSGGGGGGAMMCGSAGGCGVTCVITGASVVTGGGISGGGT